MAGEYGGECVLKDLKGMAYFEFLLQHANETYSATTVCHLGKDQSELPATPSKSKDGKWKHEPLTAPIDLPMSNQQRIDS